MAEGLDKQGLHRTAAEMNNTSLQLLSNITTARKGIIYQLPEIA